MVDVKRRTKLLEKRVAALGVSNGTVEQASGICHENGMRGSDLGNTLRKEWLNDILASGPEEFRQASVDPDANFLAWVKIRSKNRYHVSFRKLAAAQEIYGSQWSVKLHTFIWPQEIALAQRCRLSDNPTLATLSAMFLREAEKDPGGVFADICEIYINKFMESGFDYSPIREMKVPDIRFLPEIPNDLAVFQQYAAAKYEELLEGISREKLEFLAEKAADEEIRDRNLLACRESVVIAREHPLRRMVSVISSADLHKLKPNELYQIEEVFLSELASGKIDIQVGSGSPYGPFIAYFCDKSKREEVLGELSLDLDVLDERQWDIANLTYDWLERLPTDYRKWKKHWKLLMEQWQTEIIEGNREIPMDPVSDFGFFLFKSGLA